MLWFHMHFFRGNVKAPSPRAHSSSTCCSSPELAQFFHLQGLENPLVSLCISSKAEGPEQTHSWKGLTYETYEHMNRQLTYMKQDPWDPVLSNFLINFPLNLCYYQDQERISPAELHWLAKELHSFPSFRGKPKESFPARTLSPPQQPSPTLDNTLQDTGCKPKHEHDEQNNIKKPRKICWEQQQQKS